MKRGIGLGYPPWTGRLATGNVVLAVVRSCQGLCHIGMKLTLIRPSYNKSPEYNDSLTLDNFSKKEFYVPTQLGRSNVTAGLPRIELLCKVLCKREMSC